MGARPHRLPPGEVHPPADLRILTGDGAVIVAESLGELRPSASDEPATAPVADATPAPHAPQLTPAPATP